MSDCKFYFFPDSYNSYSNTRYQIYLQNVSFSAADVPRVVSCLTDTFVVTEREVRPNWTVPVFSGSTSVISNYPSGGIKVPYMTLF